MRWEAEHPEIVAFLETLGGDLSALPAASGDGFDSDGTLTRDHWTTGGPEVLRSWAEAGARLGALPSLGSRHPHADTATLPDVAARKALQLHAFIEVASPAIADSAQTHIVDWCAGKGHLGRELARRTGLPLVALELQPALCAEARRLAEAAGVAASIVCGDALGDGADVLWRVPGVSTGFVVALHACGDLHGALIERLDGQSIALAPCCYTRAVNDDGLARLLSARARAAAAQTGLVIDERDLRLIHEQVSDAGARELGDVRRRQAFRLGFDAWRQSLGATTYTPMPAIPLSATRLGFVAFGARLAAAAGLPEPGPELADFEVEGWRRLDGVTRRDLVRSLFRAPLEAFLVYDRARALEERGYQVRVGTFCTRGVTPRNRLILAQTPTVSKAATD